MNPLKLFAPTAPFAWISQFWKGRKKVNSFVDNLEQAFGDVSQNAGSYLTSFLNSVTGAHLTGQQVEQNEMQMQNIEDQYQRQVSGMQSAGLNPALMYQNGASGSVPSAPSNSANGSLSDLMQLILLPLNKKMMEAQIQNVQADTQGKEITNLNLDEQMKAAISNTLASVESSKVDTLYRNLLIQYGMPEAEVNRVLKDIQVGDSNISRNEAESELARANAAYQAVRQKIDLDKLPYELANMSASARESRARAIVEEFRGAYMSQNNTDVPSGAIASLVGMLSNTFHGVANESESGWNELNYRTLFPFIDMILSAFGK